MKNIFIIFSLVFGSEILLAEELSRVESLQTVDFKDGILSVSYMTSGGCSEHSPQFALSLSKNDEKIYVAKVKILDSTEVADQCESIISVSGKADLVSLVKEEAKRLNIDLKDLANVELELPKITLTVK